MECSVAMVEVERLMEERSVAKELEGSFIEETSLGEGKFQTFSSLLDNPDRGHLVFQIGKLDFFKLKKHLEVKTVTTLSWSDASPLTAPLCWSLVNNFDLATCLCTSIAF